jgi:error-prone DNA polymerase
MYVELHAASAFSFLDGASLPETLVARAAALDMPVMALLDRDGVHGAPRAHQAAKAAGIRALVGAELTMRTGESGLGPGTSSLRPPLLWRHPRDRAR